MVKILSASPPYVDCSELSLPRSLLLVSTDPECRVSIVASRDGTTRGPTVLRVLAPASEAVTWDGHDFFTFIVTAGRDLSPVVAVSGFGSVSLLLQSGTIGGGGIGG